MDIQLKTKFNIGQLVYICEDSVKFVNGSFQRHPTPETDSIEIKGIVINYKIDSIDVSYIFDGQTCYPQEKVFATLKEAQEYCDNYE